MFGPLTQLRLGNDDREAASGMACWSCLGVVLAGAVGSVMRGVTGSSGAGKGSTGRSATAIGSKATGTLFVAGTFCVN